MPRRIDFESLDWIQSAADVRFKAVSRDERQIRLVEFAPGFVEEEWCGKSHIGFVLAGRLEFADGLEAFSTGEAFVIAAGERHRARVIEGPVRVFLVEDATG